MRDFKKFTSKQEIKAIESNNQESRKGWMLPLFRQQGLMNSHNTHYGFWRQDNHPMFLYSQRFIDQKLGYIHNNPVKAGIVDKSGGIFVQQCPGHDKKSILFAHYGLDPLSAVINSRQLEEIGYKRTSTKDAG